MTPRDPRGAIAALIAKCQSNRGEITPAIAELDSGDRSKQVGRG
ncbi:hypothetical protein [Laspinema sp. D2d]|nr:hypothetical protein [Laspinema sp. D2d]